jgi:predicted DNA-binding transcriptional regulator AlpA
MPAAARSISMDIKTLLSIPDFCARYGISRSLAYVLMARGDLRARKIGRLTRIAVPDADAWAANLPVGLAAKPNGRLRPRITRDRGADGP